MNWYTRSFEAKHQGLTLRVTRRKEDTGAYEWEVLNETDVVVGRGGHAVLLRKSQAFEAARVLALQLRPEKPPIPKRPRVQVCAQGSCMAVTGFPDGPIELGSDVDFVRGGAYCQGHRVLYASGLAVPR